MKQLVAVIIGLAVLCVAFSGFAANKPTSFAGTWIINPDKSDAFAKSSTSTSLSGMGGMGRMGGIGGIGGIGGRSGRGGVGGMGGRSGASGMGGRSGVSGMGQMGGRGMMGSVASDAPSAQAGSSAPMVIEQSETEIRITKTEMGKQTVDSYNLDGKAVTQMVEDSQSRVGAGGGGRAGFGQQQRLGPKVPRTTLAKLSKGAFDVKEVTATSNGNRTVKTAFSLSKDGKVLTMKISTSTSRPTGGMGGGSTTTSQKLVFNKQESNP